MNGKIKKNKSNVEQKKMDVKDIIEESDILFLKIRFYWM